MKCPWFSISSLNPSIFLFIAQSEMGILDSSTIFRSLNFASSGFWNWKHFFKSYEFISKGLISRKYSPRWLTKYCILLNITSILNKDDLSQWKKRGREELWIVECSPFGQRYWVRSNTGSLPIYTDMLSWLQPWFVDPLWTLQSGQGCFSSHSARIDKSLTCLVLYALCWLIMYVRGTEHEA